MNRITQFRRLFLLSIVWSTVGLLCAAASAEPPTEIQRWLVPQNWVRDAAGPVVALGDSGQFDDMHIFAPCVVRDDGRYWLWYCGSRGDVAERVFRLGLATSSDGLSFDKHDANPVFEFGDGKHSVLTACVLRDTAGQPVRENGKLRMWFSATHFAGGTGLHTLHATTSTDGIHWTAPSAPLLDHVYAPSVIRDDNGYQMWYTDVSDSPWIIRRATSADGIAWKKDDQPALIVDQPWEQSRLFYPHVIQTDGVYLMWYGSYWSAQRNKTALGLAVSVDGKTWFKNPHNPVLRPDPERAWESHYVTSQSVVRGVDGHFRIWYASRKAPPFVNKYFAINTARWQGPEDE